jgi:hypothetical protein
MNASSVAGAVMMPFASVLIGRSPSRVVMKSSFLAI